MTTYISGNRDSDDIKGQTTSVDHHRVLPPKGRKHSWKKAGLPLLGLLVLAGGGAAWFLFGNKPKARIRYVVQVATRGNVSKAVTASGTLKAWSVVDIKSKAGGRVDLLSVEIGDRVKKGQVIAKIDPSDSLLAFRQVQSDLTSARAKQNQSAIQHKLQIEQTLLTIQDAQAQSNAAKANLEVMESKVKSARDQATSQVRLTTTNIQAAEANYQNAIKQRQQLDATQPQDRATAQSAYDQAAANDANNRANLERQRSLLVKGFVARSVADQAEATAKVSAAQVASAQTRLAKIETEQQINREAADARVLQAQAQLENARAQSADIQNRTNAVTEAKGALKQAAMQLKQSEVVLAQARANHAKDAIALKDIEQAKASVERNQATMANASKALTETTVRCPIDGVVLEKNVEQGTIITSGQSFNSTGTSLVQIGDISKMYVNVSVDETDIASIKIKQPVRFTVDAFKGDSFKGAVARVSPEATVTNNVTTYAVRVEIDNANPLFPRLRPGMNATCRFFVSSKFDVVTVPPASLHSDERGTYVELVAGTPAGDPGARSAGGRPFLPADGSVHRPPAGGGFPSPGGSMPEPLSGRFLPPSGPADAANGGAMGRGPGKTETLSNVKPERRYVQTGLSGAEGIEITSGLAEGERVVVQTINPAEQNASAQMAMASPFGGGPPGGLPPGGPPGGPPPGGPPGGGPR